MFLKEDEILKNILDFAVSKGLIENDSVVYRDLFDTEVMDILTPYPPTVIDKFNSFVNLGVFDRK